MTKKDSEDLNVNINFEFFILIKLPIEKKKTEDYTDFLDKKFIIKQAKSIFGKTEKNCKFCKETQDLQFFKVKKQSEKFLYSYLLCEIKEILTESDLKLNIIFKNKVKNRVYN